MSDIFTLCFSFWGCKLCLYSIEIIGFRQFLNATIVLSDATFIIGQNNTGKSSILAAIKYLLEPTTCLPEEDVLQINDEHGKQRPYPSHVQLIAEFRNLPLEVENWRGFKGRILRYNANNSPDETGLSITYKKKCCINSGKFEYFMKQNRRLRNDEYESCKTVQNLLDAGIEKTILLDIDGLNLEAKGPIKDEKLQQIDQIWDIDTDQTEWFKNPGGIPTIVAAKLPKFLLIPAKDSANEIDKNQGSLVKILGELFNDVRESSIHYKKAKEYLDLLEKEFDPKNSESDLGKMMLELNDILSGIFPESQINAGACLSDSDQVLKPKFDVSMKSNVETSVERQGTGSIRSAVFALLRYKAKRDIQNPAGARPLIIGFEEPEIYLHPQASNQMRDVIYDLAKADGNQIVCTTHSPYMIDLSRKPRQILNYCSRYRKKDTNDTTIKTIDVNAFTITDSFKEITKDDRSYIKMLTKIDDGVAKCFFSNKVLIVEGDTEEVIINRTLDVVGDEIKKRINSEWHVINARGKPVIISLAKYLNAMGIDFAVMHDIDTKPGATKFNQPIAEAIGKPECIFPVQNCIEDLLGYEPPSSDKPFEAYQKASQWESIHDLPARWRSLFVKIFDIRQIPEQRDAA